MSDVKLDDIVSLCKRRGFIFPGSDVYGGLSGTWDYGPLGVALKKNIMNLWWKMFVDDADNMYGVDAAILMNQKVWQASGHVDTFNDPLVACNHCKSRFRADKLITNQEEYKSEAKDYSNSQKEKLTKLNLPEHWADYKPGHIDALVDIFGEARIPAHEVSDELLGFVEEDGKLAETFMGTFPRIYLTKHACKCERCKSIEWQDATAFNMMFKTKVGATSDNVEEVRTSYKYDAETDQTSEEKVREIVEIGAESVSYLRPETAQGIFTNFKNVVDTFYPDLPFGIAQQGKAFRNEISPRDFVFRSREFEQMEVEYFVEPDKWEAAFDEWVNKVHAYLEALGLPKDMVHELEVPAADRAHYSKRTVDFEFDFPIGREELLGLAYRTDFDLINIQNNSGKSMEYRPKDGGEPFVPHVIEPSFGVERALMAVLTAAYKEDEQNSEKRVYLALPAHLAPVKVAVSPLLKNKPELVAKAKEVYDILKKEFGNVMWDDNGNIGKRYRRQDEIGTPYCVTIDFDTLEDDTVTVRNRNTTEQVRTKTINLASELRS